MEGKVDPKLQAWALSLLSHCHNLQRRRLYVAQLCDCGFSKGQRDCLAKISGIPDPECRLAQRSTHLVGQDRARQGDGTGVPLDQVSFLSEDEKPLLGGVSSTPDGEPE